MAATVTLTYAIPRNAQSRTAQEQAILSVALNQGELSALGLDMTSDTTTYFSGQFFRTVVMSGPNVYPIFPQSVFQRQFRTTEAQESAVRRLYLGRLQTLSMPDISENITIVIS
jgi:hypothetical protein